MNIETKIAKKLGRKIKKVLGSGSCGTAYLLDDNTVMKITHEENEYHTSTDLIGKRLKHICRIYATYRVLHKDGRLFAIIQERLNTSRVDDLTDFENDTNGIYTDYRTLANLGFKRTQFTQRAIERIQKQKEANPKYAWEFNQYEKIAKASRKIGITNSDMFAPNIGLRGDNLVLFDLGYNKSHTNSEGIKLELIPKIKEKRMIKKLAQVN